MAIFGYKTKAERKYEALALNYRNAEQQVADLVEDNSGLRASLLESNLREGEANGNVRDLIKSHQELQSAVLDDLQTRLQDSLDTIYNNLDLFLNIGGDPEGLLVVVEHYLLADEEGEIHVSVREGIPQAEIRGPEIE